MTRDMGHDEFYSWECCCDECVTAQLAGSAQLLEALHDATVRQRNLAAPVLARLIAAADRAALESELGMRS